MLSCLWSMWTSILWALNGLCHLSMFGLFGATYQMLCLNDNLIIKFIILNYCLLHFTSTAAHIFLFDVNFRYLKSSFFIDLLCCLPWDIIYKVFLFCFPNCIVTSHQFSPDLLGWFSFIFANMYEGFCNQHGFLLCFCFLSYIFCYNSSLPSWLLFIILHELEQGKGSKHCYRVIRHEKIGMAIVFLNILWRVGWVVLHPWSWCSIWDKQNFP